jgi:hypothetical protein
LYLLKKKFGAAAWEAFYRICGLLSTFLFVNKNRLILKNIYSLDYSAAKVVLLPPIGCELVVINRDAEEQEDLLKDWVAVITSFCCRLYGLRRGTRKAKEIKDQLQCDAPSE